jgi:hypothetical protein
MNIYSVKYMTQMPLLRHTRMYSGMDVSLLMTLIVSVRRLLLH